MKLYAHVLWEAETHAKEEPLRAVGCSHRGRLPCSRRSLNLHHKGHPGPEAAAAGLLWT